MTLPLTVTAVIATYNRPDTLAVALRSVHLQTRPVDEVIVVGDMCDDRTLRVVEEFNELSIRFVNLPVRCGEQAIPNAIGTILARSNHVAYLNHDDLWLPHHIETGLAALGSSRAKWFLGASLFSYVGVDHDQGVRPVFSDVTVAGRKLSRAFGKTLAYLEPVSTWIVEREAALKAGNWKPANATRRTPVQSLGLRLWRTVGAPVAGDGHSAVKLLGGGGDSPRYHTASGEHEYLASLMAAHGGLWPDWVILEEGARVARDASIAADWDELSVWQLRVLAASGHPLWAWVFRYTGADAVEFSLARAGADRGHHLTRLIVLRTGERTLTKLSVNDVLSALGEG